MPRKRRELVDGGIYHVFNRGNDRRVLFECEEDYSEFRRIGLTLKGLFDTAIYHYCWMSNHFHMLVRIQKKEHLSDYMHRLQLGYARYFKKAYGFVGYVFQERFRSPLILDESYYLQCGRYIERNPVKAKMVEKAWEYPYSSAKHYVLGEADALVTPNLYYDQLGITQWSRQERYKEFLELDEPYRSMVDAALLKV